MASVPVAPNIIAPITNAGRGANHQPVKPPVSPSGGGGGGPVPVASALQGGVVGTAYSETITAQGGTSPYSFAVSSGSLPAGLSLSSAGVISGTPTTAATASFTVTVTDAASATGSQAFTIAIAAGGSSGGSGNYGYVA